MKKLFISENEKKNILEMYVKFNKQQVLLEGLDFSKPLITLNKTNSKDNPNEYMVNGFISFDVTKSEITINNAIQKIKEDLDKQGIEMTNLLNVTVYGGASNYVDGPMNADYKNTDANDPFKIEKVTNKYEGLSGEKNREKNLEYAKNRANSLKNVLIKEFPSSNVIVQTYSRIMDTGGKIDEKRDTKLYPIPGQQATFKIKFNTKKKEKQTPPFDANEKFKQTESNRTSSDSSYYGSKTVKINNTNILMCKILTNNDTLGLKTDLPDIGLNPFQAEIKFDKTINKYRITNKSGKQFTKMQLVWIYWYLINEENANMNCKALDYVVLPSWIKTISLDKVTFGAMSKEYEFVHDKTKHNLVK